jgi:hypothetical protein
MDESNGEDKRENRLSRILFFQGQSDMSWKDVIIRWAILGVLSTAVALFLHSIGWVGPGSVSA